MSDPIRRVRGQDPALFAPKPRGMRRLSIRHEPWFWSAGSHIRIQGPDRPALLVRLTDFTGQTWDDIERRAYKQCVAPLTPGGIVDYINRVVLGYTNHGGFPPGVIRPGVAIDPPTGSGWRSVSAARGTWWWSIDGIEVVVMSPEGVRTRHRLYQVNAMGLEAWGAACKALHEEAPPHAFMCTRPPSVPDPTDGQVRRYITEHLLTPPLNPPIGPDRACGPPIRSCP